MGLDAQFPCQVYSTRNIENNNVWVFFFQGILIPGNNTEFKLFMVVNVTGTHSAGRAGDALFGYQFYISHDSKWSTDDVSLEFTSEEHASKLTAIFTVVSYYFNRT